MGQFTPMLVLKHSALTPGLSHTMSIKVRATCSRSTVGHCSTHLSSPPLLPLLLLLHLSPPPISPIPLPPPLPPPLLPSLPLFPSILLPSPLFHRASIGRAIGMCSISSPSSVTRCTRPRSFTFFLRNSTGMSEAQVNLDVCDKDSTEEMADSCSTTNIIQGPPNSIRRQL